MNDIEVLTKKMVFLLLVVSFVCVSLSISANAKYYNIAKKAGAEGKEVKIGKTYFYYENRSGCGKAYRYYKYYTAAMLKKGIYPGEYFGKNSWTNGKTIYYIVKNKLYKVKIYAGKSKVIKLGLKKYKYKIKQIRKSKVYIERIRKNRSRMIVYNIMTGKVKRIQ